MVKRLGRQNTSGFKFRDLLFRPGAWPFGELIFKARAWRFSGLLFRTGARRFEGLTAGAAREAVRTSAMVSRTKGSLWDRMACRRSRFELGSGAILDASKKVPVSIHIGPVKLQRLSSLISHGFAQDQRRGQSVVG